MLNKELERRGVPMPQAATKEEWEAMRPEVKEMLLKEEFGYFFPKPDSGWLPQVLCYSGFYGTGVKERQN